MVKKLKLGLILFLERPAEKVKLEKSKTTNSEINK